MTGTRAKTGGRKAGTPNRRTREAIELLASMNCDPIRGMAEIAEHPQASLELRGRMYSELAGYCYPKRKAVEHSDGGGDQEEIRVIISYEDVPLRAGLSCDGTVG